MITVRKCTTDDVEQLIKISEKTFDETFRADNSPENMAHYLETAFTVEKMTRELNNAESQFFFAMSDEKVAGYLKVNIGATQSESMGDDKLEVERIYIDQDYQKQGIGKVLMNLAIDIALENNKTAIWLGVWEKNPNAIGFYEKAGFVQTSSHSFFMGDEEQTDLIMVKVI